MPLAEAAALCGPQKLQDNYHCQGFFRFDRQLSATSLSMIMMVIMMVIDL
jgi:hypothetical protein